MIDVRPTATNVFLVIAGARVVAVIGGSGPKRDSGIEPPLQQMQFTIEPDAESMLDALLPSHASDGSANLDSERPTSEAPAVISKFKIQDLTP